jgi:hypothetical protein
MSFFRVMQVCRKQSGFQARIDIHVQSKLANRNPEAEARKPKPEAQFLQV